INLTPNPSSASLKSPLTFTAMISNSSGSKAGPTGSVTFGDSNAGGTFGSTSCSTQNNGSLACNAVYTAPSTPQAVVITANYEGDFVHKPATGQSNLTVKSSTTTALGVSANPSVSGQYLTFTATVSPSTSSGTVQFQVDGNNVGVPVSLSGGAATWSTSSIPVGLHVVTAVYSGNLNSFGSTGIVTQTINQDKVATLLSTSDNPSSPGQQIVLTATINAQYPGSGTPTGYVTFYEDGANVGVGNLIGNSASVDITPYGGSHTITAVYSGDSNFVTGYSAQLTQIVSQDSSVTVSTSQNPSTSSQQITLTATVSSQSQSSNIPTGNVQFVIDGSNFGSPVSLSAGTASLDTALSGGNHTITASYLGDSIFLGSTSSSIMQLVTQSSTVEVSSSQNPSNFGQPVSFTATVSTTQGTSRPSGTVTFYDGSSSIGTSTVSDGQATYDSSSLSVGPHTISVMYSGDSIFASSTSDS
ncbi:MAG: Ig-like domain repeat protein, partial [Patescibacteria group bacterium]|nr:Ig-like domain repeat protein [Patescibacteria group bacterium]